MAEEVKEKESQATETTEQKPETVTMEEYEALKKAQAGSDRAYTETKKQLEDLQKQFDDLRKESMTKEERAQVELQEREKRLADKEREVAEAGLRLTKHKLMSDKGIPLDLERFVVGETEKELAESIDTLQGQIEKLADERVNGRLKTRPPKAGGTNVQPDMNAAIRAMAAGRGRR